MRVCIKTLGCKVNTYESEYIKENFIKQSYEVIDDYTLCDVIVINTCTVTNQADAKSRKLIRQMKRENSKAILVVCGCASEHHKDNLLDLDIDILIGNKDKSRIVNLVNEYMSNHEKISKFYDLRNVAFEDMAIDNFMGKTRGFVKIQDGCNNFCSYCIIPFMRGNIRSKDIDVAYDEVKCLVENGYREIVLTGIHTGSYGHDKDYDLTDLIKKISTIDNLLRIRISSIEITELNDKFMEELRINKKIVSHFHVPIQAGSNKILKDMNRKYIIDDYIKKIKELRSIRDDMSITTDLIVGYPTEDDECFKETIENIKKIKFTKIHTFPFSKRDGTKASVLKEINDSIKKNRVNQVLALSDKYEEEFYKSYIGKDVEVLVENDNIGLTGNYIKVNLDRNYIPNQIVKVKIICVKNKEVFGVSVD